MACARWGFALGFDEIATLRERHAAWRLLRAQHAALNVSVLGWVLVEENVRSKPLPELVARLDDVIVLDMMMPKLNGYQVLEQPRKRLVDPRRSCSRAKDGDHDQTDAFNLGADDYLTKAFSFVVLVARLRALIRRGAPERPPSSAGGNGVPGRPPFEAGNAAMFARAWPALSAVGRREATTSVVLTRIRD